MSELQGFWSYVHKDDETDGGRISRLAKDVVAQYEMLTGESISLFLDKDELEWGDRWRERIDKSLGSVAFFIPVMTPRYFLSAECRRELQFFARRATESELKDLILPLHYVDVSALDDDSNEDELIKLARTFQWEDWRELRFADFSGEKYRRSVAGMAARLVSANRRAEQASSHEFVSKAVEHLETDDDSPGWFDRIAGLEEVMPKLQMTMEGITHAMSVIGTMSNESAAEMNSPANAARGFGYRVVVAKKLARHLREPVETLWTQGNAFSTQFHAFDEGVCAIIESASSQITANQEAREDICKYFTAMRALASTVEESLGHFQELVDVIAPIEKGSRDMRPVLRRLRQALTLMIEGRKVSERWSSLIEASGIDCPDTITN